LLFVKGKSIINNQNANPKTYIKTFYSDSMGTVIADSVIVGNSFGGQDSYTPQGEYEF
jgi:hypothetical protein